MKLVNRNDIENIDDALEAQQMNTCYLQVGDEVVRCYLNHETYKAYVESNSLQASEEAGMFLIDLGYEAVLRG